MSTIVQRFPRHVPAERSAVRAGVEQQRVSGAARCTVLQMQHDCMRAPGCCRQLTPAHGRA
eukprot:15069744-Alexandrium_andersonii.AAC.1